MLTGQDFHHLRILLREEFQRMVEEERRRLEKLFHAHQSDGNEGQSGSKKARTNKVIEKFTISDLGEHGFCYFNNIGELVIDADEHCIVLHPDQVSMLRAYLLAGIPTLKHNGTLGEECQVYYADVFTPEWRGISIDGKYADDPGVDRVRLHAEQALSLLDWLIQERAELERLAKEQEGE